MNKKMRKTIQGLLKGSFVVLLSCSLFLSNIPFGTLDYLSQKLKDSNVVDVMWQSQNSKSVVDSFRLRTAVAAENTIQATAITDATQEFGPSPTVVFITEQTGYIFYVDTGNDLVYRKTTNGGTDWATRQVIDSTLTGWTNVSVWYDQWTPGDTTGTKIHIAALDNGTDDAYYTFLDTNGDLLKGSVVSVIPETTVQVLVDAAPSITKGAGGALFLTANISSCVCGYVYKSTDGAGNTWGNVTPASWSSAPLDQIQLLPLITDNDIIAIKAQTGDNTVRYRIYDEVSDTWDSDWSASVASLTENTTYDQWFSATIRKTTGDVYLAFNNNTNNVANDIEFWSFDEGVRSWTQGTNVRTDSSQLLSPVPLVDEKSGDIYVAYAEGAGANNFFGGGNINALTHIFYHKSTDGGTTWSSKTGSINNDTGDDYKYLRGNLLSSDRLYVAYYDDDDNIIYGSTIWSSGVEVEANIDTAAIDVTDQYGPAPSGVFVDDDVGYKFYVRTNTLLDATDEFGPSPSVVFTDANTGYVFFVDATMQSLVYRKTIDGGATWGGSNVIDTTFDQGWTQVSVWYDRWTPGDTGTRIHIAAASDTTGDVYYSYVDTVDDSIRSGLVTAINQTTFTEAANAAPGITKGGGGNLFISVNLASTAGGYVVKSTNGGDSWSSVNPSASASADQIQLLPLLTDNDIIAIMADVSADVITYQIYDEVADTWSGSWTTIATLNDGGGGTYDQWFSATLATSTGDVYLTFTNSIGTAGSDIEFWTFDEGTRAWTQGGNVVTDSATVITPVPFYRASTNTLYVAYARGTINSVVNVYFRSSANGGTSWSAESSALATTADDFKSMRGNMTSDDNLYVVWYNDDIQALVGDRILSPITAGGHITSALSLVYKKTTDGGRSWGIPWTVAVTGGTTVASIWYDQWTPGDTTGTKIHIAFSDDATNDYYYFYFDTATDRPHPPVAVLLGTLITEAGVGVPGITKGASGNLFLSGNFNTTAGGQVAKSTDNGASWTSITPGSWSAGATDQVQLLPLLTDNDIIAIIADAAGNDIDYRIYDEVSDTWAGSWTEIGTLTDNATYDQWFSASLRKSTGDTYLAFANNTNNAANDIEFWSFDDGTRTWTAGANVITDSATTMMPVPLIDEDTGDIYTLYLRGTLGSGMNVYYKKSSDGGVSWSGESKPLSPGIYDDVMSLRGNLLSSDRLYAFWYNDDLDDIYGNTVSDQWSFSQTGYRWFANTNSTDVGTPLVSQNTSATLGEAGEAFRLRVLVSNSGEAPLNSDQLKLQFAERSGTCDVGFLGEVYADVTGASVISYNDNATPTNGSALTDNANDPTTGNTVVNQTYVESNTFSNTQAIILNGQDGLWDFSLKDNGAPVGKTYCFRVVKASGQALDSYSVVPQISMMSAPSPYLLRAPVNYLSIGQGLVGHWTFDGPDMISNVADRSGNNNHGNLIGQSATTTTVGKLGQALGFDGVDDGVNIGDVAAIDSATTLSGCAWVKPSTLTSDNQIIDKSNATDDGIKLFRDDVAFYSGRTDVYTIYIAESTGVGDVRIESATNSSVLNTWTHVCFTYIEDTAVNGLRLYINGVEDANSPVSTSGIIGIDSGTNPLNIGRTSGGTNPFPGSIDDVRIYNRALSDSEVRALYSFGVAQVGAVHNTVPSFGSTDGSGLIAHWTFDGPRVNWSSGAVSPSAGRLGNGYVINMSTTSSPSAGKLGQALYFNGVDSYIHMEPWSSLRPEFPFSKSAWVKVSTCNNGGILWTGDATDITYAGHQFRLTSTCNLYSLVGTGSGGFTSATRRNVQTIDTINLNEWNHVVVVVRGISDRSMYINGVEATLGAYDGTAASIGYGTYPATIGRYDASSGTAGATYLNGYIDDVRLYGKALTTEEVGQLYRGGIIKKSN